MTITGAIYFGVYLSPAGDALAYWTPDADGGSGRNLVIAQSDTQPVTFASGEGVDILGWVSDNHVKWYDLETQLNYVGDVCGDSVPLN